MCDTKKSAQWGRKLEERGVREGQMEIVVVKVGICNAMEEKEGTERNEEEYVCPSPHTILSLLLLQFISCLILEG